MSNNLPIQLTRFIGRQSEMADIQRLLGQTRLLTLTGPGGGGKTRLAIEAARQVADDFGDGVFWVDLASLSEESLVTQTVAIALDALDQPGQTPEDSLVDFLNDKQLLLLLDNCEHLIASCARLVDRLLHACRGVSVMATSLEPLRVVGETAWALPPLSVPSDVPKSPTDLGRYDAAALFVDRAKSVSPSFTLTADNAASVGRICRRLDGLPLAIELAASRVNVLTTQQIADRLDDRFALLKSETRSTTHPRHHTLRATIDWSYNQLSTDEQSLLRRMTVFETGCTLEAAETTCSDEAVPANQILELLSSLVAKSLIFADTTGRTKAHFRLLESVRAFALERARDLGEESDLRDRHLSYYVDVVEEAAPNLVVTYQKLWFNWLVSEQDDIRAALRWSLTSGRIEDGMRIINALGRSQYWAELRYVKEWQDWLGRLLAKANDEIPVQTRLEALTNATSFCGFLGHDELAVEYGKQAVTLAEQLGDPRLLAPALNSLSRAHAVGGDHETAYLLNQRSVQLHRAEEEWIGMGFTMLNLAMDAIALSLFDEAATHLDECLVLARSSEEPLLEAHTFSIMGEMHFCRQDYEQALVAYETSLPILRQAKAERDSAAVLLRLGYVHLELGDYGRARSCFQACLELQQKTGNQQGMAESLTGYGALALCQGVPKMAVTLLTAAVSLTGGPKFSLYPTIRLVNARYLSTAREQLTDASFFVAQEEGRRLSLDKALELANRLPSPSRQSELSGIHNRDPLTPRQREVASLIGRGMSNGQIAEELVLSKRTVEKHVANILAALGLENRAELIRWALENC